jgi:DNA-binding XRE family transcriptional regulator
MVKLHCGLRNSLSQNYYSAYEEIRTLGLTTSPAEKFPKLQLSWQSGKEPANGTYQIKLTLTYEEIAEMIGATRETVSRLFSDFKKKQLLQVKGSTLGIRNKPAWKICFKPELWRRCLTPFALLLIGRLNCQRFTCFSGLGD